MHVVLQPRAFATFVKVSSPLGRRGAMHGHVRIAASFAFLTLLGALFPTVASAATPAAAAGGSDFVTALVIAGGGALVIMLIMVAVPAARRGSGSSAPIGGAPPVTAF